MSDYAKPYHGEDIHGEFYQFCKRHELRFPTLPGLWRLAPHATRELCGLRFVQLEPGALSGKGQVFSWQ